MCDLCSPGKSAVVRAQGAGVVETLKDVGDTLETSLDATHTITSLEKPPSKITVDFIGFPKEVVTFNTLVDGKSMDGHLMGHGPYELKQLKVIKGQVGRFQPVAVVEEHRSICMEIAKCVGVMLVALLCVGAVALAYVKPVFVGVLAGFGVIAGLAWKLPPMLQCECEERRAPVVEPRKKKSTKRWMPVSGAWTTGLGHAYRVQAKVWGVVDKNVNERVVSALEEGVQQDSHMAFALINIMELLGEESLPRFCCEGSSYLTEAERGLPVMQQYVKTEHGAKWSGELDQEYDEGESSESEVSESDDEAHDNNHDDNGSVASPLLNINNSPAASR